MENIGGRLGTCFDSLMGKSSFLFKTTTSTKESADQLLRVVNLRRGKRFGRSDFKEYLIYVSTRGKQNIFIQATVANLSTFILHKCQCCHLVTSVLIFELTYDN